MNSIQRVLAALTFGKSQHGKPDRVPCLPVPLMQGALVYQCSVKEYFDMPARKIAHAQVQLNKLFDEIPDAVAGVPNVIEGATGLGAELTYPFPNSTPTLAGMVIRDFKDILTLKPRSWQASAQLRKTRDIIATLADHIGGEKVVIGVSVAPFSLPSLLMGTEGWMRLLLTPEHRRQYLQPILKICKTFVIEWCHAQLAAGAHVVVLADGMASATMLPRDVFQQYAKPVIQETIRAIKGLVVYEAVGRTQPIIDLCGDLGAAALLIGEEDDVPTCKAALKGQAALIGNINNMKMRRWSPARVEMTAKRALRHGMPGYGFALANQGPEIPFDTSVDSIRALVEAVVKYGQYPQTQTKAA